MTSDLYIENKVKLSHNVVQAIRNELSLEKETSLKLDDLLKITSLHVVDITNDELEQITHFTNLVNLSLCFLGDVDLFPLQNLHALKYLALKNMNVETLSALAQVENLIHLDISDSSIADFSCLASLNNLTKLRMKNCDIDDLEIIGDLTSLTAITEKFKDY